MGFTIACLADLVVVSLEHQDKGKAGLPIFPSRQSRHDQRLQSYGCYASQTSQLLICSAIQPGSQDLIQVSEKFVS